MGDSPDVRALARGLSRWFGTHARELPWRESRDPYRIWVSEIMLQQTRVDTVRAYFGPFVQRFPTVRSLAEADQEAVLEQWSGLGYYRRARLLHKGARYVVRELNAKVPDSVEELRKVPGIGPYTAGALASIAYDQPEPLVDGNVARVSTRLRAVQEASQQGAQAKAHWNFVGEILKVGQPRVLAQALMELGALVCKPKTPDCESCPVRKQCGAYTLGLQSQIPAPKKRKASPETHFDALGIRWGKRLLMERRPAEGLLASMWCLPLAQRPSATPSQARHLRGRLPAAFELQLSSLARVDGAPIKHVFTHRVWHLQPWILKTQRKPKRPEPGRYAWILPGERPGGGVPAVTNKLLERLGY